MFIFTLYNAKKNANLDSLYEINDSISIILWSMRRFNVNIILYIMSGAQICRGLRRSKRRRAATGDATATADRRRDHYHSHRPFKRNTRLLRASSSDLLLLWLHKIFMRFCGCKKPALVVLYATMLYNSSGTLVPRQLKIISRRVWPIYFSHFY